MKTTSTTRSNAPNVRALTRARILCVSIATALAMCFFSGAHAATLNWNKLSGGPYSWNDTANWTEAAIPNAVDDQANMNKTFSAVQTINLNVPISLGTWNL